MDNIRRIHDREQAIQQEIERRLKDREQTMQEEFERRLKERGLVMQEEFERRLKEREVMQEEIEGRNKQLEQDMKEKVDRYFQEKEQALELEVERRVKERGLVIEEERRVKERMLAMQKETERRTLEQLIILDLPAGIPVFDRTVIKNTLEDWFVKDRDGKISKSKSRRLLFAVRHKLESLSATYPSADINRVIIFLGQLIISI